MSAELAERAAGLVAIGRILRSWGREGAVVVEPWTSDPSRFSDLREVAIESRGRVETRALTLVRVDRQGRPLVRLAGVADIDAAERLRGAVLKVPEAAAVRPPGESYFHHELLGCAVATAAGTRLGTVEGIVETGGANVLLVRAGGREVLVPAARPILVAVDVAARVITIDPPPGLLEVNEADAMKPSEA